MYMNRIRKFWCFGGCVAAIMLASIAAAPVYSDASTRLELLSKLQMMSEGSYTTREWNDVNQALEDILAKARQNKDWNEYIEIRVIQAKVMAARRDHAGAMTLMQETLNAFRNQDVSALKKVYLEVAALHARVGNERGVTDIMNEFRNSRHYDAQTYDFSGGAGPGDPIVVTRPQAGVGSSISLTAMSVQKARARFAAGQAFPDTMIRTWDGAVVRPSMPQSRLLLVDVWAPGMTVWRRELANLIAIYNRHHRDGLQVLGLSIDPNEQRARTFVQQNNIPWQQATAPRELTSTLGIFGEAANYLIDHNGMIIGRNLNSAELEAAIRGALAR